MKAKEKLLIVHSDGERNRIGVVTRAKSFKRDRAPVVELRTEHCQAL